MEKVQFTLPSQGQTGKSAGKVMAASIFWDSKGVIMISFLEKGRTINGLHYSNLVKQLLEEIKSKTPGMLPRGVIYDHDNAPAYRSAVAKAALHAAKFALLEHPPYSRT